MPHCHRHVNTGRNPAALSSLRHLGVPTVPRFTTETQTTIYTSTLKQGGHLLPSTLRRPLPQQRSRPCHPGSLQRALLSLICSEQDQGRCAQRAPFTRTAVARTPTVMPPDGHCRDVDVTRLPSIVYRSTAPGVWVAAVTVSTPGALGTAMTLGVTTTAESIVDPFRIILSANAKPDVSPL